jgi:23S rRNA (uracil1939-C5)-methyltransferase
VLSYSEQLHWKRRFVVDALERIGHHQNCEALVAACVPSPLQWHYRNKVELEAFVRDGKLCLGMHKKESHELVGIDECLLLPEGYTQLPAHLAGALNYSLKEAQDYLTRVAIRISPATGSAELALYMLPSGINRAFVAKTLGNNAEFTSLARVIISGEMAERKVKKVEALAGAGCWQEELSGNRYKISAPSFFQANSKVAEAMISQLGTILDELGLSKTAHVADLYCGAGTFTLPLARRFNNVSAIESQGTSIRDLRRNLEEGGLNAQVIGGDVARELAALGCVDVAVIDPPRSGLRPEATRALLESGPKHLVYVSCNPATMARDIKLLAPDYQLRGATPFDQFPQSYHVEVMAWLSKQ